MAIMMAGTMALRAQPGGNGFQRPSVEDRVKRVHGKMDSAFHLEAKKLADVDSAFAQAYRTSDAKRDELRAASADRDTQMAAMKVINDARDAKLQTILTADQYKTWKEQIEPTMRGGRPGGGGGGNGNGGNGGNR